VVAPSCPTRGALRDRHERWVRDAMDVSARETKRAGYGRQSRVVLIPRRWDQARRRIHGRRGLTSPVPRGDHGISRNTVAQGVPVCFGGPVVTNSRTFYLRTRGCGCARHAGIPCSLSLWRVGFPELGRSSRRENTKPCKSHSFEKFPPTKIRLCVRLSVA
jgi:hypothetical protein